MKKPIFSPCLAGHLLPENTIILANLHRRTRNNEQVVRRLHSPHQTITEFCLLFYRTCAACYEQQRGGGISHVHSWGVRGTKTTVGLRKKKGGFQLPKYRGK